jgi:hypothetical protein
MSTHELSRGCKACQRPEDEGRKAGSIQLLTGWLLLLLAAVGGEWIVHQLQYLIEYGAGYGAEMASSPHRLYVVPLGGGLATAALLATVSAALILQWFAVRRRLLLRRLPARLREAAMAEAPKVSMRQLGLFVLALLCCQLAIYFVQENAEAASHGAALPGLSVLISSSHWSVLPLHVLLALGDALLLATFAMRLSASRQALEAVEALVRLLDRPATDEVVLGAAAVYLPCLRLSAGRLGLRSPPLNG